MCVCAHTHAQDMETEKKLETDIEVKTSLRLFPDPGFCK